MNRAKALKAASAVFAVAIWVAAPAGADVQVKQVKTEVKFLEVNRQTFMDFSGQIGARKVCRDGRKATLLYKADAASTPQTVGTAKTDKSGAFLVTLSSPAQAGLYSVQIKLDIDVVRHGDDKTRFVCKPVSSAFVSF